MRLMTQSTQQTLLNRSLSLLALVISCALIPSSLFAESEKNSVLLVTASGDEQATPLGYGAKKQMTATKGEALLLETPQFVSVINRQQLDNQPSESISQALRYSVGISSEKFGAFGSGIDFSKMRGFDADYYLDGLKVLGNSGIWGPQIDSWGLQSIEAVHGPSSALYGQGGAGGLINMISRRPDGQTQHQVQLQMGNNDNRGIKFDSTSAIDEDETWLYRLSGSATEKESQIPSSRQTRFFIAPALTWQPSEQTRWTMLGNYQHDPRIGHYNTLPAEGLGLRPNPNGKLDPNKNYSDPNHERSSRKQYSVTSLFEHQFNDHWQFKQNSRYSNVDTHIKRDFTRAFLAGDRLLTAVYQDSPSQSSTLVTDNQLISKFSTGSVEHTLLTGLDYQTGRMAKDWWGSQTVSFDPWGAAHRPDFTPYPQSKTSTKQTFNRYGIYLQDQLRWQNWHLVMSGRHDWSYLDTENRLTGKIQESNNRAWSHRVGLSYQFDNGFAPWISTSDSFDPILGTDEFGKPFVPTEAHQIEAGLKYQNLSGDMQGSVALYQLTQENVTMHNPRNPDYYQQTGKIRSQGIEFESRMLVAPNINLMLNYAYTDNKVTATTDPITLNKRPVQVPAHSGSAWADYRFQQPYLEGALVGIGVRYLGSTWGDNTNTFKVPAVWLGDASFRYQLDAIHADLQGLELGLTVSNFTNKSYVASCTSSTYCSIGTDRTLLGVLNYYF